MHLLIIVFQAQGAMRCVKAPMSWERTLIKCLHGNGNGLSLPDVLSPMGLDHPLSYAPKL